MIFLKNNGKVSRFCTTLFLCSFFFAIHSMEQAPSDKTEHLEFERGIQNYKTAQTLHKNFKIVQEDDYKNALRSYCPAIRQFELALVKKHPLAQQNIDECLEYADPKKWGLLNIPEGMDELIVPESLKNYLKEQSKTSMPPLPLKLVEESKRKSSPSNSPKTPPSGSGESHRALSTERSDSDGELNSGGIRRQLSKLLGKHSPLRASSTEKERPTSPKKPSPLQKSAKKKDLKTLLQEEESSTPAHPSCASKGQSL